MIYRILAVFICCFLGYLTVNAQITDTVPVVKADTVTTTPVSAKSPGKDSTRLAIEAMPRKAAIRSAIIPGWGQYYNGGLWWIKVPAIYGGFVTLIAIYDWNQNNYKTFLNELQYRIENNGQKRDFRWERVDNDGLIRIKDLYRRDRDLTIIGMAGWYALNIIEAYVDAKFFRFDVSEDLSLKVSPSMQKQPFAYAYTSGSPSIKLTLAFKSKY